MSSGAITHRPTDSGRVIKYTACARDEHNTDEDELEEISVVDDRQEGDLSLSNLSKTEDDNTDAEQGCHSNPDAISEKNDAELNGPKLLPGSVHSITSSANDRTKLIGDRVSSIATLSSPINSNRLYDQKGRPRSRTTSRQSIFELVRLRTNRKSSREDQFNLMNKHRSTETVTTKEVRKQRRKEIDARFGKKSIRSNNRFVEHEAAVTEHDGCNWTFVFDPSGRLSYWWSSVVSIAFIYNFWVIIYRFAFQEINAENRSVWFALDYIADFIYIMDIAFHFRTGYLEDGVLQTDTIKLRLHYMNTTLFYIDLLCLLPLDFLYLSIGFCSILRCFRLVKVYRFWTFLDRTERHTNYPNVMRTLTLMHYLLALFHWNACLYYLVANTTEKHSKPWVFPKENGDVARQYLHALYWSTLTLTTVGNLPRPRTNTDYVFIIFELMFGLLLFATVLGHISNIVSCVSAARKDFQAKLDNVKTYMLLRRVPLRLQDRVIKWFDYLWMCNKSTDEERTLSLLPDKLKAEIAIHVHLDTLKRVEIFQQTEAGFLCELVLRLNPVLFSPGDYICRKGEVGKEMYIVNRGRLQVVGDDGKTVFATLKPGSYFGEISILNMGTSGNRRTASVRSVGYSDLFRLSKQDLWDVLKEYPAARVKLEYVAVMRLDKTKKKPIDTVNLTRSKSTPGLIESSGKTQMQAPSMTRHHTLPAGLPSQGSFEHSEHEAPGDEYQGNPPETQANTSSVTFAATVTSTVVNSGGGEDNYGGVPSSTPPARSPFIMDGQTPMFHFSPPTTPAVLPQYQAPYQSQQGNVRNVCGPVPNLYPDYISRDMSHDYAASRVPAQQVSPQHFPFGPFAQHIPVSAINAAMHSPHPMTLLAPYCASTGYIPIPPQSPSPAPRGGANSVSVNSVFSHPASNINNNTHNTNVIHSVFDPQGETTHSPGMVHVGVPPPPGGYGDESRDTLVTEITRLRERLRQVESENAMMASKLNQQQYELEHRLSELEMHLTCTSDMGSTGSTDDRSNPFENISRESII